MFARIAVFSGIVLSLAGCGAVLPGSGPAAVKVSEEDVDKLPEQDYLIVQLDEEVVRSVGRYHPREFADRFGIRPTGKAQLVGVGDKLTVNIWEAGDNGLFSNLQTKSVTIESVVDEQGLIFVPYAGRIRAAGRHVEAIRRNVQSNLLDKAIQPQVQIIVAGNDSNSAVIVGDVTKPGKFPISLAGTRVLDLVASAGGSKFPTYETAITLKRGRVVGTTLLDDLFDFTENNVFLKSGDNILLAHNPRSFSSYGAVGKRSDYPFDARTVTLAEGLAKTGGLNDRIANRNGVFLFRFEPISVARKLRPERDFYNNRRFPVVYKLSMNDPRSFFLMQHFELRDKDILYVANHPSAEFGKFLRILGPVLGTWSTVERFD